MKKGLWVCACILLLAVLTAAPLKAATSFNFGLKAGASFANVRWSDDDGSEKWLIRPTFGAFALVNLTSKLAIQPEVDYLVMGEWWSLTDGGKEVEEFTYLHIPVLLRYKFMESGKFVPFVLGGPTIGFLLSAEEGGESVKDWFKGTDIGLDLGAGGEFPIGKMKGLVDLRYHWGLTNNYEAPILEGAILPMALMDFTMKTAGLSLTVGIIF
jgi:hypothetical protein